MLYVKNDMTAMRERHKKLWEAVERKEITVDRAIELALHADMTISSWENEEHQKELQKLQEEALETINNL